MNAAEATLISWSNLSEYIERGIPALLPVSDVSRICFVVTADGMPLSLRLPTEGSAEIAPSTFQELDIFLRGVGDTTCIELTCSHFRCRWR
jgi:hypothetical protein